MDERRISPRKPVDVFFNRFLGGYPYLCRSVDLSSEAVLVETFAEPDSNESRFALEFRFPGDDESLWLWAKRVRRVGTREALGFVAMSASSQQRIERFLSSSN